MSLSRETQLYLFKKILSNSTGFTIILKTSVDRFSHGQSHETIQLRILGLLAVFFFKIINLITCGFLTLACRGETYKKKSVKRDQSPFMLISFLTGMLLSAGADPNAIKV